MNRSFINNLFLTLVFVSLHLILFSCAGPQEIPESEKKYVEGVVVEGGVNGFRLKDDNGKIIRFYARDKVEYDPLVFHAYYGDRLGVIYYPENKRGKDWHEALKVVLLTTNPNRIDFRYGAVDGIIRARGVMRYLVYLPENDLTVAFYRKQEVKYSPRNWIPKKKGNKVKVYFSEDSERFFKKLKCYRINRLGEDLVSIQDKIEVGVITKIFVHRSIHKAPDRFAFQLKNGDTLTMYSGGETILFPKGIKVQIGESYSIEYYRLLMGDQSLRYVATMIEEPKILAKIEPKIEPKIAVIVNPNEPWTGTWKVKGGPWGSFVLKLKQSGNMVKSIRGSDVDMKAKVKEDRLKGLYGDTVQIHIDFKISEDFTLFKGKGSWYQGTFYLKGERKE